MFTHNNIHVTLPNGDIFSVAVINGKSEVAVFRGTGDRDFVPVPEWSGEDYDDDVLPISGDAESLARVLGLAIKWAEWQNTHLIAHALDQAL